MDVYNQAQTLPLSHDLLDMEASLESAGDKNTSLDIWQGGDMENENGRRD